MKGIAMLDGKEYDEAIEKVAFYPHSGEKNIGALNYCVLGLNGEAGEVAEKLKKMFRDDQNDFTDTVTPEKRVEVLKELGDVLWYLTRAAHELDSSLDEIAQMNVDKLYSRHNRGMLGGSGDNR